MKKIMFLLASAGIIWWGRSVLRKHREVLRWWSIAEQEASEEIDSGLTEVFIDPISMFRTGR